MDRVAESGLEMKPSMMPEVAPQPDENMYYMGGGAPNDTVIDPQYQSNQSYKPQVKSQGWSRVIWVLGITAILCLAVAVGVGVRAGLAAQHKSNSSSSSSGAPITVTQAISASVTTPQSTKQAISTSVTTPQSTKQAINAPVTIALSGSVPAVTPTPVTLPSSPCPAADRSTYTATNKPLPTLHPQIPWLINGTSFFFEIICYTTFNAGGNPSIMDLQIITNVTSLTDCLDACALYNFQMRIDNFPVYACTGIAWGRGDGHNPVGIPWPVCYLKSNVSMGSPNSTNVSAGYDGAVLLLV